MFRDDVIIEMLVDLLRYFAYSNILRDGSRTNYLLKVLAILDLNVWKNKDLKYVN
jgi:hypothetical protein